MDRFTFTFDMGQIITALAPTIALLAAAWIGMREARRTRREAKEAAEKTQVKVDVVHALVNDQLTREKEGKLVVLRSQYVLMERLIVGEKTKAEAELLLAMSETISTLETEISKRDMAARRITAGRKPETPADEQASVTVQPGQVLLTSPEEADEGETGA